MQAPSVACRSQPCAQALDTMSAIRILGSPDYAQDHRFPGRLHCVDGSGFRADLPLAARIPPAAARSGLLLGRRLFRHQCRLHHHDKGQRDDGRRVPGQRRRPGRQPSGRSGLPRDGFTGGGQLGYNFQFTPGSGFVVGAEADLAYTDLNRTRSTTGRPGRDQHLPADGRFPRDRARPRRLRLRPHPRLRHRRLRLWGRDLSRRLPDGGRPAELLRQQLARVETGYAAGGGIEFALPTDSVFNIFHSNAVTLKARRCTTTSAAAPCRSWRSDRASAPTPPASATRACSAASGPELQVRQLKRRARTA